MAYGASTAFSRASTCSRATIRGEAAAEPGRRLLVRGFDVRFDDDLDRGAHAAPDLHHDRMRTQVLDRVGQQDAPPVDGEPAFGEEPLDVEVGDRAEQAAGFARQRTDGDRETLEL